MTPQEAARILSASAIRQEACRNDLEEGEAGCTLGFALSVICAGYVGAQVEADPESFSTPAKER